MSSPVPEKSRREQLRAAAPVVAIALAVVFALVNLDRVKVDWIVGSSHTPLIVVIAVAFGLGIATGWLAQRRRRHD